MAKIELLEVPVAGEALRWLGSFAVRRGEGTEMRYASHAGSWPRGTWPASSPKVRASNSAIPGPGHAGAAMIAIQEGVPLVPCGLDTFQWSMRNRRSCAIVWGEPIDLLVCRGTVKGTRRAPLSSTRQFSSLAAGGGSGDRGPSRELPDGARRTGPLSGDDVSYVDATPWPDDEWARGPLGPVYPGAG